MKPCNQCGCHHEWDEKEKNCLKPVIEEYTQFCASNPKAHNDFLERIAKSDDPDE